MLSRRAEYSIASSVTRSVRSSGRSQERPERRPSAVRFRPAHLRQRARDPGVRPGGILVDHGEAFETADKKTFSAKLIEKDGKKIAIHDEASAKQALSDLQGAEYRVIGVKEREQKRNPAAPFITSTLQQEASRKLGFSNKKTMSVAQDLYEGIDLGSEGAVGLITYMRTDSTRVAGEAIAQAESLSPRSTAMTTSPLRRGSTSPGNRRKTLTKPFDPHLYRTPEAMGKFLGQGPTPAVQIDMAAIPRKPDGSGSPEHCDCGHRGEELYFPRSRIHREIRRLHYTLHRGQGQREQREGRGRERDQQLPKLAKDEFLRLLELLPKQHFTEPPPRYTEATLVKALEERGIGRPSTYAAIISTIQDRKYVVLEQKRNSSPPISGSP